MANLEMIFWDVQHGNATYIKTPNNKHIVIDLGLGDYSGNNEQFSPLVALRQRYGVQQLDYVIITHPHKDHIDDIGNFDSFSPKVLRRPRHITNAEVMEGVRAQDREKFVKYCQIGDRYNTDVDGSPDHPSVSENYGGVVIKSFTSSELPKDNFNNHSIITVVEYATVKVVIPGDNEVASFDSLMQKEAFRNAVKNANILLAPHHGRQSGFHNDFVSLVNPSLTIVSDGSICDTSANGRYSQKSSGWLVHHKKNNTSESRRCLTTNRDGEIYISIGYNGATPFLEVSIY